MKVTTCFKAVVATAAIATAGGAAAQDLSYGGLIGSYGVYTDGNTDVDVTVLGGELGYTIDNFDMWVSANKIELAPEGLGGVITGSNNTFGVGYTFDNGMRVDVSSNNISAGIGIGISLGFEEIGVGYDNGAFFGRLSYSALDEGLIQDTSLIGLLVGYEFAPGTEVSLSAHLLDEPTSTIDEPLFILEGSYDGGNWGAQADVISFSQNGTDLSLIALGGHYDFNQNWGARGSFTRIDLDGTDIDNIRLGGTYTINDQYTLFGDISQVSSDAFGDDINSISFGVSMDFGDKPTSYETTTDRVFGALDTTLMLDF